MNPLVPLRPRVPPRVAPRCAGEVGREHSHGFTLIELMIAIIVLAVFLGMAAPTFTDVIRNRRLTSQINQLVYRWHSRGARPSSG